MKRAGKDAIADYIVKAHNYHNIKVASTLKDVIKIMFNMSHDQVEGDTKEVVDSRWGITPRQAMQFVGTEVMQYKIQELMPTVGRYFWIKQLCEKIKESPPTTKFAVSDIRFVHEVEELRRQFGQEVFVLKVMRPCTDEEDMHASEQEWMHIPCDITISNNGNLIDLYNHVNDLFSPSPLSIK